MNLLYGLVAGGAIYLLARKSSAPGSEAGSAIDRDPRAREGDGTGSQPDQAGAPVTTATTVAPTSTTVAVADAPLAQGKPGASKITALSARTTRFFVPPAQPCGDCSQETQSTARDLVRSGAGADIRF